MFSRVGARRSIVNLVGGIGGILITIGLILIGGYLFYVGRQLFKLSNVLSSFSQSGSNIAVAAGACIVQGLSIIFIAIAIATVSISFLSGRGLPNVKRLIAKIGIAFLLLMIAGILYCSCPAIFALQNAQSFASILGSITEVASGASASQILGALSLLRASGLRAGIALAAAGFVITVACVLAERQNFHAGLTLVIVGGCLLTLVLPLLGAALIVGGIAGLLMMSAQDDKLRKISKILLVAAVILGSLHFVHIGAKIASLASLISVLSALYQHVRVSTGLFYASAALTIIGGIFTLMASAFLASPSIPRFSYGETGPGFSYRFPQSMSYQGGSYAQYQPRHLAQQAPSHGSPTLTTAAPQVTPAQSTPQPAPAQQSQATAPVSRMCPQCGAIVPIDYAYCPRCGYRFS